MDGGTGEGAYTPPQKTEAAALGAHTIILSKNIHKLKVTKTDYVWFEFLWIRR